MLAGQGFIFTAAVTSYPIATNVRLLHSKKINRTTMRFKKTNAYTALHSFNVLAIKPPILRQKDALIKQPFIFMSFLSE